MIANVLNVPINRITTRVRRIGGGFGGKETIPWIICTPVAFVSHTLRRPVRCMLDRDEDMMITGGRHPCYFKYKLGFTTDGILKALVIEVYLDAGFSHDISMAVSITPVADLRSYNTVK